MIKERHLRSLICSSIITWCSNAQLAKTFMITSAIAWGKLSKIKCKKHMEFSICWLNLKYQTYLDKFQIQGWRGLVRGGGGQKGHKEKKKCLKMLKWLQMHFGEIQKTYGKWSRQTSPIPYVSCIYWLKASLCKVL